MNKQIIKKFGMDIRTISYLRRYCRYVPKCLTFETSHEAHILGFGVPNAKYLAFGTPDKNALCSIPCFHLQLNIAFITPIPLSFH